MYVEDIYFTRFNAVCNLGGFFSIPAGVDWLHPLRPFEQCKFYFITEGSCSITIEGVEYHAKPGDWFFIPANTKHAYQNDKSAAFSKYWMHFDLYPDVTIFSALGLPFCVRADSEGRALRLFKEFVELSRSSRFVDRLTIKSRLIELIGEYIKAGGSNLTDVISHSNKRFDSLLWYIDENLDKPLSNEQLAQKYFTHPNHFVRAFKSKTGQTPAKYIRNKKMEAGKRLLEGTEMSISEVAAKVGFTDPAHFSRLFRERYGMPPSTYREYYKRSLIL